MTHLVRLQVSRASGDCAICALAMLLDVPYEDVFGAAVKTTGVTGVHHSGMWTRDMKRTARKFGVTLTLRRSVDLENDEGVLSTVDVKDHLSQHAVLLKAGLIIDGDCTVWEADAYLKAKGHRPLSLLVRDEE